MIKEGDIVKVTGKTVCEGIEKECIPIGTICRVIDTRNSELEGSLVEVVPYNDNPKLGYWYLESDVKSISLHESKSVVNVEKLINTFTNMANRGSLLARGGVSQQDLLIQIVGTIVHVASENM